MDAKKNEISSGEYMVVVADYQLDMHNCQALGRFQENRFLILSLAFSISATHHTFSTVSDERGSGQSGMEPLRLLEYRAKASTIPLSVVALISVMQAIGDTYYNTYACLSGFKRNERQNVFFP